MGASKLGEKEAACSHAGILHLQYISSYVLTSIIQGVK